MGLGQSKTQCGQNSGMVLFGSVQCGDHPRGNPACAEGEENCVCRGSEGGHNDHEEQQSCDGNLACIDGYCVTQEDVDDNPITECTTNDDCLRGNLTNTVCGNIRDGNGSFVCVPPILNDYVCDQNLGPTGPLRPNGCPCLSDERCEGGVCNTSMNPATYIPPSNYDFDGVCDHHMV